jgi:hypothetical protein
MGLDLLIFAQQQFGGRPGGPPPGFPGGPGGGLPPGAGAGVGTAIGAMLAVYFIIILVFLVPTLAGMWKAFSKAGQPGWAAIVPLYNLYVMGEISGKGGVYGILVSIGMGIPCIGLIALIFYIIMLIDFCKAYDQGAGMAIGLLLLGPIFWPILGFGSAEYIGTSGGGRRRRAKRRRDYDDDEDDDYDRPPRRSRRDEDDDDDRPRRSRRDDEDDRPRREDDRIRRKPRRDDDY